MRHRREIRKNLREALQRVRGEAPPAPPAAPVEFACLCGQLLRMSPSRGEKRCACPSCGRKFLLTFAADKASGRMAACPVYIDDAAVTGETLIPEAPGSGAPAAKGGFDDALFPAAPAALAVACPGCARKMKVVKSFYDKRARCPDCQVRMLLTLVFDPATRKHTIEALRVSDGPSGDTRPPEGSS